MTFSTYSRARGARRTVAGRRTGIAPREPTADSNAAQHPPAAGRPPGGNRDAPGAGCLPLALAGHVGAGEHSSPASHRSGNSPQHRQWRAESRRQAIPPAPASWSPARSAA